MAPRGGQVAGSGDSDFVVVANRLPVDMERLPDGSTTWKRSPGGLVTALEPLLRRRSGAWIGWAGVPDADDDPIDEDDLQLYPVPLSADDIADYYEGFSNATLWPLYHDVIVKPIYHREWWDAYVEVNRRFAEATAKAAAPGATVWVQDYQLQLVPKMLRMLRPDLHHRLLPAHPVPAGRAVHADAVAHRDRRGPARRRPGRLPPARRRPELPVSGPPPGRREHLTRNRRRAVQVRRGPDRFSHGPGRRLPDLHRLDGAGPAGAQPGGPAAGPPDPQRARQSRARSCSVSTGSTTPRASTSGCGRSRSCSPSIGSSATTPCWCSSRRRAANASTATRRCATTSNARSATSTANTAKSAIRSCTTCTGPSPATS